MPRIYATDITKIVRSIKLHAKRYLVKVSGASLKRVLVLRTFPERFRMTTRQDRYSDSERGTACHKITIGMMAIMKITMGNRPNRWKTRNEAYTLGHASAAPRKLHDDDSRSNFHFIIPRFIPPLIRSFLHFPPFCPPHSSCLIMHHFGNNVRGFLTAILSTRVERSPLPSRYSERIRSTLSRLRQPVFPFFVFLFLAPGYKTMRENARCFVH